MKNINLKHRILQIHEKNLDKTIIIGNSGFLSVNDLNIGIDIENNSRVLVCCQNQLNTFQTLVSIDGIAEVVCSINPSLSVKDKKAILAQIDFSHLITDIPEIECSIFEEYQITIIDLKNAPKIELKNDKSHFIQTSWLIPTSGTTASPKLVKHTLSSLTNNVKYKKDNYSKQPVWGLLYDITRYAGYQVLFQAILSGCQLVISNTEKSLNQQIEYFVNNKVTHISATPTLWRKIVMTPASKNLDLKTIILGGEAADQKILNNLSLIYNKAKITHVYASTEGGVALSTSDGQEGFPLNFLQKENCEVKIKVKNERLYIKSTSTAISYSNSINLKNAEGWIDSGDLVQIKKNRFFVIGRANGVINVGGDKIFPEKVRKVLLGLELVRDAIVYGKKNPFIGYILVADIELTKEIDNKSMKESIKSFINNNLPRNQRPQILNFVKTIKTNSTGKADSR